MANYCTQTTFSRLCLRNLHHVLSKETTPSARKNQGWKSVDISTAAGFLVVGTYCTSPLIKYRLVFAFLHFRCSSLFKSQPENTGELLRVLLWYLRMP